MYKRLRYLIRYSRAFVSKHYLPLLFGSLLAIAAFFLLPRAISLLPQFRLTRHIALVGRYTLADLPKSVQTKIGIGLTVIGPDGLPGPGLAKTWEATDSGKLVIFHLNPSLTWQDKSPIKSSDIQYQFRDARISYPQTDQIVFQLQDPYSPLPAIVSRPVFKKPANRFLRQIIGSGSYKIKAYHQNGPNLASLTLAPVQSGNSLPFLTYHFYPSPQQARIAFKLGLVQEVADLSELNELGSWPNTEAVPIVMSDRYVAAFFNTDDPFLTGTSGKNLRLALAYATVKTLDPNRATGPIAPTSWAYNSDVKKYDFDLDRAKELLQKVEKLPDKLVITTLPAYLDTADNLKSDWQKLGLEVEVRSQTDMSTDFQVSLAAQAIPVDPDQYIYWHSTQDVTNITHLKNPRIDKLLEDGRKTWDQAARQKIYADFQKYLVEEIPAIFLFHPTTYSVIRK